MSSYNTANFMPYEPTMPRNESECFMINTLHDAIDSMDPEKIRTALNGMSPELLQQPIAHYSLKRCPHGTADCRYEIKPIELKSSTRRYAKEDLYVIPLVLIHFKNARDELSDHILHSYNNYGKKFKELVPHMLLSEEYTQLIADTKAIIDMLLAAGASLESKVPTIDVIRELERYGPDDHDMSHEEDIYDTYELFQYCMYNILYPIATHLLNIKPDIVNKNLNHFLSVLHYTIDHNRPNDFMQHVHTNEMKTLYSKLIRMYEAEKSITLPECSLPKEVVNDIHKNDDDCCYLCKPLEYDAPFEVTAADETSKE
jgi:hypothetical protein